MAYNAEKGNINIREEVLTKTWQYLFDNFHKFTEANKIKVALALAGKSIPTSIEHSGHITYAKMDEIKRDGELMRFKIGEN